MGITIARDPLRWRLAECIAWCSRHGTMPDAATAASKLRTPEICPRGFTYLRDRHGYAQMEPPIGFQSSGLIQDVVEQTSSLRVEQLKLSNSYPLAPANHLAGGRLLCYAPHENLAEGVEEKETQGYFDVHATPPWDTWLWFVTQQTRFQKRPYGQEFWYDTYLISWVPPELINIVDTGAVYTSTTFALAWADELDSELLAQLRAANIST